MIYQLKTFPLTLYFNKIKYKVFLFPSKYVCVSKPKIEKKYIKPFLFKVLIDPMSWYVRPQEPRVHTTLFQYEQLALPTLPFRIRKLDAKKYFLLRS